MECVESIELLSEYHADALGERLRHEVRLHLAECPPCNGVMLDLESIIRMAATIGQQAEISYPDEDEVWVRLKIIKSPAH